MLIKNCRIIYLDKIEEGSVLIEDGKIKEINPANSNDDNIIDANGAYLSPALLMYTFMVLVDVILWMVQLNH